MDFRGIVKFGFLAILLVYFHRIQTSVDTKAYTCFQGSCPFPLLQSVVLLLQVFFQPHCLPENFLKVCVFTCGLIRMIRTVHVISF